eukprot:11485208-Alexandrium_andersonii.AAC.1
MRYERARVPSCSRAVLVTQRMPQDMLGDLYIHTTVVEASNCGWPCRRARGWTVLTHKTKVARAKARLP